MSNFLRNFFDYPIVKQKDEILPLLRDDFTRAVLFDSPDLKINPDNIIDIGQYSGAQTFWKDDRRPRGRRIPGEKMYDLQTLTLQSVDEESRSAGIVIPPKALADIHQKMVLSVNIFSQIVLQHSQRTDFFMRVWQMWAPREGQGRTPVPHIDRTALTGLWYAGRATAKAHIGDVSEDVWQALSPQRQNEHQHEPVLQEFGRQSDPEDWIDFLPGMLVVTRNSKDLDLNNPSVRRTVCIHKSGDVRKLGQAGIVMVPKFMS